MYLFKLFITFRYSAQVSAAVAVFIVTWIVLPTGGDRIMTLGPRDDYKFRVFFLFNIIILASNKIQITNN